MLRAVAINSQQPESSMICRTINADVQESP